MKYRRSTPNERVWCITQLAKLSFNHSIGRTHSWRWWKIIYSYLWYLSSPRIQNKIIMPNPTLTNALTHAIKYSVFSGVFDAGGCSYHTFHVFPRWDALCNVTTASATVGTPPCEWAQLKVLSRAIHVIFSLPKIGGVVRSMWDIKQRSRGAFFVAP